MRISHLSLRDLRRYREVDLDLAPGLTIVRGPNEAGKSTLQRAIELGLTRKVTSAAADIESLAPWDGDAEARTVIGMTFTYDDEDGVPYEGRLEKSFGGARGHVRLEMGGEVITDPARADEELAALSGIPTEGFFRSTASVRHHELAGLQRDEGALRDRLQASISGADRGTSRARKKLERALQGLQAKGAKNPGRLKVAEDAVTETAARLRAGEEGLARLERDRDALAVARDRRSESETALTERRSLLEKARQAERLIADRDAARERFERYRSAVILRDEVEELDRTHPSAIPLPILRTGVERLRTSDTQIATLENMLAGEVQVTFEVEPEVRWRHLSRMAIGLVALGLAISVVGTLLGILGILTEGARTIVVALGIVAVVPGLILAAVALLRRRGDRTQKQLRDEEVNRRLRGRSEIEQELRVAVAGRVEQLARLELSDTPEAEELLRLEDAHVTEIDQRRARLGGLDRRGAARCAAGPARHRRAGDRAEDLRARRPGADRPRAARSRTPRGGGRGRGALPGAGPRRRGQRPCPRRAEPRGRRGGRGPRRAPRIVVRGAGSARSPRACLRPDARARSTPPSRRRCSWPPDTSSGAWSGTSR